MNVCNHVGPEKKQAFSNVSLNKNTVANQTFELVTKLYNQLMKKGKDFIAFFIAIKSSDASETAQLAVLICGVDSNMCYKGTFGIKINAWHNHKKGNL